MCSYPHRATVDSTHQIKPCHGLAWNQSSFRNEDSEPGDSEALNKVPSPDHSGLQNNTGNGEEADGRG